MAKPSKREAYTGPGTVHGSAVTVLHVTQGRKDTKSGAWDLMVRAFDGAPIVRHRYTRKLFSLSWDEILDMADRAGTSEEGGV